MRLIIHHNTHYHYEDAPKHLIQLLRLSPREDAHQRVINWHISTPGKQTLFKDAFGNLTHTHMLSSPLPDVHLQVSGIVDVAALVMGVVPDDHRTHTVPAMTYLVPTPLTTSFSAIDELAQSALPHGMHTGIDALVLARAICQAVLYRAGNTDVTSTAKQAFELASGVCQDHAHVMIAACRSLLVPARYVSGYVDPGNSRAAASHAWVDVWLQNSWVSIDVTNGIYASDSHCRLAIGRDYLDACPVRGMREGGQTEQLDVSVTVESLQQ
ncbi:MAG: transglutaminase family protein [Cytophagales bacterium]|nr:transglutaminase family protein [Cytophagales bacterium]